MSWSCFPATYRPQPTTSFHRRVRWHSPPYPPFEVAGSNVPKLQTSEYIIFELYETDPRERRDNLFAENRNGILKVEIETSFAVSNTSWCKTHTAWPLTNHDGCSSSHYWHRPIGCYCRPPFGSPGNQVSRPFPSSRNCQHASRPHLQSTGDGGPSGCED